MNDSYRKEDRKTSVSPEDAKKILRNAQMQINQDRKEAEPGRILRDNPDYEAILAAVEEEAGMKETRVT